ncbi:MAG: DNA polymerase III subunit epsilon [Burkholderiales bacterium]|nr:DNA polymerase III subunit epsilon [Burkholderiales bacterium]
MTPARRPDLRAAAAALLPGAVFALLLACAALLLAATLGPSERAALWTLLEPRIALVAMLWFLASLAGGAALGAAWRRWGAVPGRLAEQLQVLAASADDHALAVDAKGSSADARALVAAANALVRERQALRGEIAARVAEASRAVEQERSRLAALMAELNESVVVCNLDGRILLFNARARLQLRTLADTAGGARIGGVDPVALGRSIYALLDRRLVAHALEAVRQRLARGAAHPTAQFVTGTAGGQLLRVQLAPVRAIAASAADEAGADAPLNGFVLLLDNITREIADADERDRLLQRLGEGSRGSVGNLQAAVELLDDPELDAPTRERFLGVIRDEIGALSRRLADAAAESAALVRTRWPMEDMLGADLAAAAARRIEAACASRVQLTEIDAALWLRVESWSVVQALLHLALRLEQGYSAMRLQIRLAPAAQTPERAQLDLVFPLQPMSTETVLTWETEPLEGSAGAGALTLRDVVARHGGAFWFERERAHQFAFFRLLLPLAAATQPLDADDVMRPGSRPEFYDFDLFGGGGTEGALGARRLADLTCTVFDTETTGLDPSAGDKIIQIGAVRVDAGKLRRNDSFEQLVDPGRTLPEAGIAIHGIRPEMLRGQPDIATVLPALRAFAADSVLVAHNAAFDMRFLQLEEQASGVRFDMPVLDTLLLSAVLHPRQDSHSLEAIAERLGVTVLGRHTALGDAIVTAEVFLKMIPLLEGAGIATLAQALEASRRTYLARLSY